MNKQELIGHVADRSGLSRSDAMRAVETMLEVITSALKRGDEVRLVGFGNFSVTRRQASTGRNPRTGGPTQITASPRPKCLVDNERIEEVDRLSRHSLNGFASCLPLCDWLS